MQHLLIIVVFRVKLGLVKAASSLWGCGRPNLGWHHQWSDAGTHSSLCSIWSHPLLLVSAGLILRKLWDVSLSCFSQTLTRSSAISSTYFSFPLQVRSSSALCLYPPFFTCWPYPQSLCLLCIFTGEKLLLLGMLSILLFWQCREVQICKRSVFRANALNVVVPTLNLQSFSCRFSDHTPLSSQVLHFFLTTVNLLVFKSFFTSIFTLSFTLSLSTYMLWARIRG